MDEQNLHSISGVFAVGLSGLRQSLAGGKLPVSRGDCHSGRVPAAESLREDVRMTFVLEARFQPLASAPWGGGACSAWSELCFARAF